MVNITQIQHFGPKATTLAILALASLALRSSSAFLPANYLSFGTLDRFKNQQDQEQQYRKTSCLWTATPLPVPGVPVPAPAPPPVPDVPGEGDLPGADPLPSPVKEPGVPSPTPDIFDPNEDPNVNVNPRKQSARLFTFMSDPAPLHDPDFPGDIPTIPSMPPNVDPTAPRQPTPAPEIPLPSPSTPPTRHPDPTAL